MNSKKLLTTILGIGLCATVAQANHHLTASLKDGKTSLKSAGALAFGPEGILFVGDAKGAAVVAIATGDTKKSNATAAFKVSGIDGKVAAALGTKAENIIIHDLAVNPISRNAYLSVSRGRDANAAAAIVKVTPAGKISVLKLAGLKSATAKLPNAPKDGMQGQGRRRSNPRHSSITDIGYIDGKVLVAGLSNEEFASNLRSIPFPFKKVDDGAGVEIFHGAHGKFETRSPVRTFVAFNIGGSPELLAAYTCTPLVRFPISDLKANAKIRGTTIAELGNRNRPLDMIVYNAKGKDYVLIANSSRGIMKLAADVIEGGKQIAEKRAGGPVGTSYETIKSWTGIDQLDKLDANHALVMQRSGESLDLVSRPLP